MITVAPQNDICPHGNTYPINAVPIVNSKMITPEIQTVGFFMGELKYTPRPMCMNMIIKNKDAPFMCVYRVIAPISTSRMMWITESNLNST